MRNHSIQDPNLPRGDFPENVTGHWSLRDNPCLVWAMNKTFPPPLEPFDPEGPWRLRYDLVYCGPRLSSPEDWVYHGWLEVNRSASIDGRTRFEATQQHILGPDPSSEWQQIETDLTLNNDSLGTLPEDEAWTLKAHTLGQSDPAARPFSQTVEQSRLVRNGKHLAWKRTIGHLGWDTPLPLNLPITTNLGLMDALQRIRQGSDGFPGFGIIKQGSSWCPGQRLKPLGESNLSVKGETLRLHGFLQTGHAHLPTFYWLDSHNRMVSIRYGILALILNPEPFLRGKCPHEA